MFYSCTNDFHKHKKHIHIILKPFSILNPNLITLNFNSTSTCVHLKKAIAEIIGDEFCSGTFLLALGIKYCNILVFYEKYE